MKTSIKTITLLAAFALLTTGAFAAGKVKKDTTTTDVRAWASLNYFANSCGIDVTIEKATPGNSTLTIYDGDGDVLLTDSLVLNAETVQKSYLLTNIADGDYTIEITSNNNVVEKTIELRSDETDDQLYSL
jgi:hypothetical protein